MKALKITLFTISISFAGIALQSCGTAGSDNSDKQGKEYTSDYICPMHCEGSGSDAAGTCPVCGMDYVKNENHEGHNH